MSDEAVSHYTLFWEAMSGAMVVELVLEEMALSYRRRPVDMAAGEHRAPEYLALNPTGQVPALALPDGQVIGESVAIILTLGDRHPDKGIVPDPNNPERPGFLRWLVYMAASPYMPFVQYNHPERFLHEPAMHDALIANAGARLAGQFDALDAAISGDPYFLRSGLSALDLYLFMLVTFHPERDAVLARRARLQRLFQTVCGICTIRSMAAGRPHRTACCAIPRSLPGNGPVARRRGRVRAQATWSRRHPAAATYCGMTAARRRGMLRAP